jgi:predicted ATP-grasp superfamily ATP-dependent carboligase
VLIAECAAEKFPAANLMAQTSAPLDPAASARLLAKAAEIAGFQVDTSTLQAEGNKIEGKLKDAMEKMKNMHEAYNQMQDNPMYG